MHVCMSLRARGIEQASGCIQYCREDVFFKSPKGSIDTNQKFRTFLASSTPEGLTTCNQILVVTHIFARTKVVIASHFQELGGSWSVVTKTINP